MTIRISPLALALGEDEVLLRQKAAAALGIRPEEILEFRILKKSLDARRKNRIHFVYSLELTLTAAEEERALRGPPSPLRVEKAPPKAAPFSVRIKRKPAQRPVVVGTGPAGLFAALTLAQAGLPPLIVERGKQVPLRLRDVERFWRDGTLEKESNVQFGEGGAGTFSDGKLFTRLDDSRIAFILETFCRFGAPAEILYLQRPHIGTDRLRRVILAMRRHLEEQGAEFMFQSRMTGLKIFQDALQGVVVDDEKEVDARLVLLAPGHSARDTFLMLRQSGIAMEAKSFAVGVRIEHPQKLINRIQYGPSAGHPHLPPAEYFLTARTSGKRAVYSFCMCPGGQVIAASSEPGGIVTNGMSLFRRNSPWANSAILVNVNEGDFGDGGPLAGMEFQRRWEERAFVLGGGCFRAPAQGVGDFLKDRFPKASLKTSFRPGVTPARLDQCLPPFVAQAVREALPLFNRKMAGFSSPEAVLLGVETRTSAPLRILRGEDFQSLSLRGLYPAGEGSGYAGGIVSSALDGVKCAQALLQQFA